MEYAVRNKQFPGLEFAQIIVQKWDSWLRVYS
jgi:hypothetical protein